MPKMPKKRNIFALCFLRCLNVHIVLLTSIPIVLTVLSVLRLDAFIMFNLKNPIIMKNVSEIYTLKSLANFLSYGAHHGEYLNSFVRFHSKHYDYFITNCNMSSSIWLVALASRPYVGFPLIGQRLVILGPWQSVYNYIVRVTGNNYKFSPPDPSGDDCPF